MHVRIDRARDDELALGVEGLIGLVREILPINETVSPSMNTSAT
jgi:hypothetical protein